MKIKNLWIRIFLILIIIISISLFHKDFGEQFQCYFTGKASVVSRQWFISILNIVLFLLLLIPLSFRRKANWGEYGIITGFFVSLFIEMYGFPLTIYFASRYFTAPVKCAPNILEFSFLGVPFGMELPMLYTSALIFIGTVLIIIGWVTLYRKSRGDELVKDGIYRYSRHPQYLGFIMIVFGWFLDWPTLITVIFAPILIMLYIRVCKIEENEISKRFPEYEDYKKRTPLLI